MKKRPAADGAEFVIPKEQAVFWMDAQGRWHNQHGPFQHKKIIDHFNAAIQKDENGYFVGQLHGDRLEKVYFRYVETALFAVDLQWQQPVKIILNTGAEIELAPEKLFVRGDQLYQRHEDEIIKFSERAMMQLSKKMDRCDGGYVLNWKGHSYRLPETG